MQLKQDEQDLIKEALGIYVQLVQQQMPADMLQPISDKVQTILEKLPALGATAAEGMPANKPHNISEEWFNNVCTGCDMLSPSGCTDSVTEKFPGKCDPILKYERAKFLATQA